MLCALQRDSRLLWVHRLSCATGHLLLERPRASNGKHRQCASLRAGCATVASSPQATTQSAQSADAATTRHPSDSPWPGKATFKATSLATASATTLATITSKIPTVSSLCAWSAAASSKAA